MVLAVLLAGAGWLLDGAPVCLAPGNQGAVDVASLPGGRVMIAWRDPRRGVGYADAYGLMIGFRGDAEAGWTSDGNPIVGTNEGRFFAVNVGAGPGSLITSSAFVPGFVAAFKPSVGRWTETGDPYPGWPGDGLYFCPGLRGGVAPTVIVDETGGVMCVWQQAQAQPDSQDIFALRIEGEGVTDPAWPPCGRQLTSDGRENTGVNGITDGSRGAYVCWYTNGGGPGGTTLVVQRILDSASIAPGWPDSGYRVQLGAMVEGFYPPAVVGDGDGGVFVAWRGRREDADFGVYAIHLTPDGRPAEGWPEAGFRLATSGGSPLRVVGCANGRGGAWLAWDDRRADAGDIYSVAIPSVIDTASWLDNPTPVCRAVGMQQKPVVTPDNSGGVVVAWEDNRNGLERDIYAVRLLASGSVAPGWTVDGLPVCTAPADQFDVQAVSDGTHGAVMVWADQRSGFNEVNLYAQRIDGDGIVGSTQPPPPAPPPPATVRLLAPRPNPVAGVVHLAFELPQATPVTAAIVDIHGRRVRELARAVTYPAGTHSLVWDGVDSGGRRVRPGIYLVHFEANAVASSAKVCILR